MNEKAEAGVANMEMQELSGAEPGGRSTNSPPSNWSLLQTETGHVVGSGVDKLVLAVDLFWRSTEFFKVLDQLKKEAAEKECPAPGVLHSPEHGFTWPFQVSSFGKDGYQWLLTSPEFAVKLGDWMQPGSRPSAMIEISSEALWMNGVVESIDKILTLLNHAGGHAGNTKVSRIDLCVDLLVQATLWSPRLRDYAVTKSRRKSNHDVGRSFSGFEFGRGQIKCRMYDKVLEIVQKSKKTWFFDIWNIIQEEMPEELRIIRIEFQLRREALKELGLDSVWEFTNHPRNLWAYCVDWLKFTDDPTKDPREQVILPFWTTVQEGFYGGQCGHPLIRAKAVNVKKKQLAQQLMGQLTSLIVLDTDEYAPQLEVEKQASVLNASAALIGMDDAVLSERVRLKQGRYLRAVEKYKAAELQREKLGLPQLMSSKEGGAA